MMTNLFSIFDLSTSLVGFHVSLNWASSLAGIIIFPLVFWVTLSRHLITFILNSHNKNIILFLKGLFVFILINNVLGLLPFVFTATFNLVFTLSLALPMWFGYFSYSLMTNTTHLSAHMVPQETPALLMPFMVLIETLSNMIRPFTLAVRLSALQSLMLWTLLNFTWNCSLVYLSCRSPMAPYMCCAKFFLPEEVWQQFHLMLWPEQFCLKIWSWPMLD